MQPEQQPQAIDPDQPNQDRPDHQTAPTVESGPVNFNSPQATSSESATQQSTAQNQNILTRPIIVSDSQKRSFKRILASLGAILFVIAGFVVCIGVGLMYSFGACFKSTCNLVENFAVIWLPIVSLLFTIPLAHKIFKKK